MNTASRMESTGEAMKIQMSSHSKELLDKIGGFIIRERGTIDVKGKGSMITYWLIGRESDSSNLTDRAGPATPDLSKNRR